MRRWIGVAAIGLAAFIGVPHADAQTDVIRGHVTTYDGLPLQNVRVTASSLPGNVTREARTDNRGAFQIAFPNGPGDYVLGYSLIGYVFRQFEVKRTADQDVLIADARLAVVQLDTVSINESVQQKVNRYDRTPDVSGTEHMIPTSGLPADVQGDLTAMAASQPGVLLVPGLDGAPDGYSVFGLGADQNSMTLNGSPLGSSTLPRDAGIQTSLTTSPYDVTRGGFSGANVNVRPTSGSNFRNRGMSAVLNAPTLEWTDQAAQALGNQYTKVSLGGVASGPISYNKSFYNLSLQFDHQNRDNQTLLGTSALGLQTAGIAMDSVSRFVGILRQGNVPTLGGPFHAQRASTNASVFGSFDFNPPNSTNGSAYNLTVNGGFGRQTPVGSGVTQLPATGGDQTSWNAGAQLSHTGYLRMLLSETTVGANTSTSYGDPYLALPAGRVLVNSVFDDGTSGVQTLGFGGNQGLSSTSRSSSVNAQNTLSWFDDANKHRIKLSTEAHYNASAQNIASNLLGTFTFNSLEDLANDQPASFTRTLTAFTRSTGLASGGVALGDSYRRTDDLQIQYGVRADVARYLTTPEFNPAIEATFGRRNDFVPTPISLSPRIGFSWTVGNVDEIQSFFGAARNPRAVIRGGVAVLTNAASVGQVTSAVSNTGLPGGVQQVTCIGPAVPIVDWAAYAQDESTIPDRCADGTTGTVFSTGAPSVTLLSRDFRPTRSVRSNLSWNGAILGGRFTTSVEGVYSLNLNQQRSVDINFLPNEQFALDDQRPVFVQPASIVQETGSIAPGDARVSSAFSRVSEIRSDLQSRTEQLSFRLSPIVHSATPLAWSLAYTYTRTREEYSGFSSTAGNPLNVLWGTSAQGPHGINYSLSYDFFRTVQVSWTGLFRSGAAYTPMIAGDVNGDGASNDRAFIYSQSATNDTALANGMRRLLAAASPGTRDCLERQLGTIAARNSCRGPWSSTASLLITLDRAKFRMPQRASVTFSLSNPLGAADLALNGSGHLKGWGQTPAPDQSLLYVRGFDPTEHRYIYEVNQRFGATQPQFVTLRSPVVLTASIKIDLGRPREEQSLLFQIESGRTISGTRASEASFRSIATNSLPNPMAIILRQQDSLHLTSVQADSIASMNRRYNYRVDSLWTPFARYLSTLPDHFDQSQVEARYTVARRAHMDLLMSMIGSVSGLLTPEQHRKLPVSVVNALDPRYLLSIRNGTGIFVGFGGSASAMNFVR
ncbi:MAG TPA: carboxypeptidase-like regulatory domain-containing protein [Gemmatimonadaceae bacterium]